MLLVFAIIYSVDIVLSGGGGWRLILCCPGARWGLILCCRGAGGGGEMGVDTVLATYSSLDLLFINYCSCVLCSWIWCQLHLAYPSHLRGTVRVLLLLFWIMATEREVATVQQASDLLLGLPKWCCLNLIQGHSLYLHAMLIYGNSVLLTLRVPEWQTTSIVTHLYHS